MDFANDEPQRPPDEYHWQRPKSARAAGEINQKVCSLEEELRNTPKGQRLRRQHIKTSIDALKWVLREGEIEIPEVRAV
jgi:hypothetical protein